MKEGSERQFRHNETEMMTMEDFIQKSLELGCRYGRIRGIFGSFVMLDPDPFFKRVRSGTVF